MRTLLQTHNIEIITRLTYPTGETKNATWLEVNNNVPCHLRTMSEQQAQVNSYQWGRAFTLQLADTVDIQTGDKVTIAGVSYNVRGVGSFGGSFPYKKVILTLPEKG